ncbi:hypothetical protein AWZ03_000373 [Drosophila navojoa]|uniref:Uncharacterized protein n=1 Tax=Drosophila navojoa TaxID=7232 RepID=A0A484BXJ8_DRONA|nr:hypothetical protein AWZ03_000373 [Drosophila navojoa]
MLVEIIVELGESSQISFVSASLKVWQNDKRPRSASKATEQEKELEEEAECKGRHDDNNLYHLLSAARDNCAGNCESLKFLVSFDELMPCSGCGIFDSPVIGKLRPLRDTHFTH